MFQGRSFSWALLLFWNWWKFYLFMGTPEIDSPQEHFYLFWCNLSCFKPLLVNSSCQCLWIDAVYFCKCSLRLIGTSESFQQFCFFVFANNDFIFYHHGVEVYAALLMLYNRVRLTVTFIPDWRKNSFTTSGHYSICSTYHHKDSDISTVKIQSHLY